MSSATEHPNAALLESATKGFDRLFSNDIVSARAQFKDKDDPFHLLGLGVCSFLEAAFSMETELMTEATRCLSLAEANSRKLMKAPKSNEYSKRRHAGLEWEIVNADAVVLLGLTQALSESYMGYLQCMYSLNSAHSKFSKLYKTVFPQGLTSHSTATSAVTHKPSRNGTDSSTSSSASPSPAPSISSASAVPLASTASASSTVTQPVPKHSGFFSRWTTISAGGSASGTTTPTSGSHLHVPHSLSEKYALESEEELPNGTVEELIVSGTAFGYGLFNLVFSLLPKKVQSLVGFLGFKHDRKLALQALALAAAKNDVHGVFSGLVLMTYHGVVLLLSGYQANEHKIIEEYETIVSNVEQRYPMGALWILNRAKILRMSHDAEGAIRVLQDGLSPNRPHSFEQADMMLVFELAWTLLSEARYEEAAETFIKITKLNSWSHATYYFIAAGCQFSLGKHDKAQALFDAIPRLIDKKVGGKDLPTEVLIKKKIAFYKAKQVRRGGEEVKYVEAIRISPAEEIGIFWNTHARISPKIAKSHIANLMALTPAVDIPTPFTTIVPLPGLEAPASPSLASPSPAPNLSSPSSSPPLKHHDLDTPDELALRSLLLGINHRTVGAYPSARAFLVDAHKQQSQIKISTWIGGVAMFELAVLDLKELEVEERMANDLSSKESKGDVKERDWKAAWKEALKSASSKLDAALVLATNSTDLSSRLDSRIAMLRDEIATKKDMVGLA